MQQKTSWKGSENRDEPGPFGPNMARPGTLSNAMWPLDLAYVEIHIANSSWTHIYLRHRPDQRPDLPEKKGWVMASGRGGDGGDEAC